MDLNLGTVITAAFTHFLIMQLLHQYLADTVNVFPDLSLSWLFWC